MERDKEKPFVSVKEVTMGEHGFYVVLNGVCFGHKWHLKSYADHDADQLNKAAAAYRLAGAVAALEMAAKILCYRCHVGMEHNKTNEECDAHYINSLSSRLSAGEVTLKGGGA